MRFIRDLPYGGRSKAILEDFPGAGEGDAEGIACLVYYNAWEMIAYPVDFVRKVAGVPLLTRLVKVSIVNAFSWKGLTETMKTFAPSSLANFLHLLVN